MSLEAMIPEDVLPGNEHPFYAGWDRRSLFAIARQCRGTVMVPVLRVPKFAAPSDELVDLVTGKRMLTLRRLVAPCPYVGTMQRYTWEVLEDDLGRCIADDAVYRVVSQRAFIEGWRGADDELEASR